MAMSLNRAEVIGNITREPDIRQTPSGQMVATIGVATNHAWTNNSGVKQEKPEYHAVVVWGKLAEICGKYLKKGSKVYFAGRMQTREWETKEGDKRRATEIIATDMLMLDSRGGSAPETNQSPESADPTIEKINVDEIPF